VARPRKIPDQWCKRCREREQSPDPNIALEDPRHEKFCRNVVLLGMNNADAYAKAGYKANKTTLVTRASRLRRSLVIRNRINALSERAIEHDLANREWVDAQLKEVVDRCMQKTPVILNGKETGEYKFDARGANTALQLMGKDRGMFVDKLQIVEDDLAKKTPEEIEAFLIAAAVDLGRGVIRKMGEAVGLFEADSGVSDEVKTPTVEPVSTVQ